MRALLESSPAFWELPRGPAQAARVTTSSRSPPTRAALLQEEFALTEQLDQMPMLVRADDRADGRGGRGAAAAARRRAGPADARRRRRRRPTSSARAPRARSRSVTRDTLNAIEFPTFVADLIKGTYNAIIDASIKQMEAYAELIANVAKTVDQFMSDNITDNQARDYLAATVPRPLPGRHDAATRRRSWSRDGADDEAKPDFKTDLGLPEDVDVSRRRPPRRRSCRPRGASWRADASRCSRRW